MERTQKSVKTLRYLPFLVWLKIRASENKLKINEKNEFIFILKIRIITLKSENSCQHTELNCGNNSSDSGRSDERKKNARSRKMDKFDIFLSDGTGCLERVILWFSTLAGMPRPNG